MKTEEEVLFEMKVSNLILEVAELYNEVTTSDLQGIAHAKAMDIIKLIRGNWNGKPKIQGYKNRRNSNHLSFNRYSVYG